MSIRRSRPGDEAELRALWQAVFQDSEEFLDGFFSLLYRPGLAALAQEGEKIVSAAYALPVGNTFYLYALATLPAFRGRGLGKAVTLAALDGRGGYLYPAEESLRDWYRREMGAADCPLAPSLTLPDGLRTQIGPEEYNMAREMLLQGIPHAVYPLSYLRLFALDGRFYRCGGSVFALGPEGTVKEVLPGVRPGVQAMALNGAPPVYWGLVLD